MITFGGCGPPEATEAIGVVAADCAVRSSNDSRVDCTVELGEPAIAMVDVFDDVEGTVRTFVGDQPTATHELFVAPLVAERTYRWTARSSAGGAGRDGTFETGALPDDIAWVPLITGAPDGFDALLTTFSCTLPGRIVLLDRSGQPVWYDQVSRLTESFVLPEAIYWAGSALVVANRDVVADIGLDGDVLLHLAGGEQVSGPLHHDVGRDAEGTLLLGAETIVDADGRVVVDDVVSRWTVDGSWERLWSVSQAVDPTGFVPPPLDYWMADFPGAADVFHTNAVTVEPSGDWLVSLRNMSAVLSVGGPSAADAGAVRWSLAGDAGAPVPRPLTWISSAGIAPLDLQGQHQPIRTAAGTLVLLDNRFDNADSRVVEVVVDEAAGTADLVASWDLGLPCPFQGGVVELDNGDLAATCASRGVVIGLARAGGEAWRMELDCGLPSFVAMVRAVPATGLVPTRPQ